MSAEIQNFETQAAIRRNAEEVQHFLRDLQTLEEDMKRKEVQLLRGAGVEPSKLPPVRNKDFKQKRRKKQESTEQRKDGQKREPRIEAYDYQAWDKFVDKALVELEEEDMSDSMSPEANTDVDEEDAAEQDGDVQDGDEESRMERERNKQQALLEKDKGNDYFKRCQYQAAIECYSRGMQADPENPLLPANRAMALLKQQKYVEAEVDCSTAILLDPLYPKAFARRGMACSAQGRLQEACKDFEMVLKLEPGNKQALAELDKVLKLGTGEKGLSETDVKQAKTQAKDLSQEVTGRAIQPISKPVHLRSQQPLRIIDVQEVEEDPQFPGQKIMVKHVSENELKPSEEDVCDTHKDIAAMPQSGVVKNTGTQRRGGTGVGGAAAVEEATRLLNVTLPPTPLNAFQLEADLRKLRSRSDMSHRYLKQIEPTTLTKIFQNSLEPDVLYQILYIMEQSFIVHEEPALTFAFMQNLSEVSRFDMATMFMETKEICVAKALLDHAASCPTVNTTKLMELRKKYRV
uniref:RNA polymerase II-associated protein 3-like isoform X2 n=1 Tax=Myxine glutinosa TaxID=7769 RepID=UPI00358F3D8B